MKKTVGIVGMGLIGGSMAKAVKRYTRDHVIGFDINESIIQCALEEGTLDEKGSNSCLQYIDLLLVALYPGKAVNFIRENCGKLKKGCIIIDLCGVKGYICEAVEQLCLDNGVVFIGGHPMAGRELSGYAASLPTLFQGASMILVPTISSTKQALTEAEQYFRQLGFGRVVVTTADKHDRMIAYTSQLAHVVSNAYIKSPEATQHVGYSAGSYKDLTRVARLNDVMWTELFLCNRSSLIQEIDEIIRHLQEYRDALAQEDSKTLQILLKEGSDRKIRIDQDNPLPEESFLSTNIIGCKD